MRPVVSSVVLAVVAVAARGRRPGCVASTLACAAAMLAAAPASAEIRIRVADCKSGVELSARNAPLAQVLRQLSETLQFQLKLEVPANTPVNVHVTARPSELISSLASQERVMISQAPDPRCPGQSRVVRVWVVPKGDAIAVPSANRRAPVTHTATREELRMHEERSRQLKAEYDAYVKTYGRPPPGIEQEEARP